MSRRLLWLIVTGTIAVAMSAGVYVAYRQRPPEPALVADVYDRLWATRLPDTSGKPQPLAQWQGRILVINFWATWCPPCREEMPILSRLQAKYAANGVQIVGIALDTAPNVTKFAAAHPPGYPLLTGDASTSELSRLLGNMQLALPYTVVFDRGGAARMTHLGRISEADLDAKLAELVGN
ncbi:MAG: TlpA disulfide reductase family protein [Propionivibrio sp.]